MESNIINLGNRVVNNYLVKIDDGYALIDTGYDTGFKRFLKKIKKFNINPQKIKYIMLTHAHDDHAGFINEVLAITPAEVVLQAISNR
ncbi:MAG: MBL fold metallo-hydrolase [Bacteroidales bacterium]|nr:MBL fold metallo-hydrolase [Bacteroidales bacterium]